MRVFANATDTLRQGAWLKELFSAAAGRSIGFRLIKGNGDVGYSGRRSDKMRLSSLEREIKTAAHHAEVVLRTVDHVPAEIIDPADMRSNTDFNATTELAD